ncbi:MAG: PAS domain S-box protein, partial [Planctomycetota bacterium]
MNIPAFPIEQTESRARKLFNDLDSNNCKGIDRLFVVLMVIQWVAGILTALLVSPSTWIGDQALIHMHVWAAIGFGGLLSGMPIFLGLTRAGDPLTRHVIAISQALWGALLIHLSGGRIETHFHLFGSLAFIAFYRDWKVVLTMTLVVSLDHALRGIFWPLSVYGIATESPFRWLEHAGWVLFEDIFLVMACVRGKKEAWSICWNQAKLEQTNEVIERAVDERSRELMLKTQEAEKLALVAKFTDNSVVITDSKGRIEWVNDGFYRCTGYSLVEVVGKVPGHFLQGPDTNPDTVLQMRTAIQNEKEFDVTILNYRKDGTPYWISIEAQPIRNSLGQVVQFIAIERDITLKKEQDYHMHLLRAAINNTKDAMFVVNEKADFVDVNEQACKRLGYSKQQLLTMSVFDIDPKFNAGYWPAHWEEAHSKKALIFESVHQCNDGEIFPVEISLVSVTHDNQKFISVFARDILERKRMESEKARLNSEIQQASRQAGMAEVATGVLHNVGNVLNSINVSSNIILNKLLQSKLPTLKKAADVIVSKKTEIGTFMTEDSKGKAFPDLFEKLTYVLSKDHEDIVTEARELSKNVSHVKEIIGMQQSFAKKSGLQEVFDSAEIFEDAIKINDASLVRHQVKVVRSFGNAPLLRTSKHDVLQILLNLVKNAKQAVQSNQGSVKPEKEIALSILSDEEFVRFQV